MFELPRSYAEGTARPPYIMLSHRFTSQECFLTTFFPIHFGTDPVSSPNAFPEELYRSCPIF